MSKDWAQDIIDMHAKFGVGEWIKNNPDKLAEFLNFRMNFLTEEYNETMKAYHDNDAEEIVDGLIDLCVIAIGTLEAFGVDPHKAWDSVNKANMSKEPGVKPQRPNPLGLPDMIKPEGWVGPDHSDNHGLLTNVLQ